MEKKIHYCWFGGKELPESARKCIDSWHHYLPDYEIIEWNEENYDVNCCDYSREAYQCKKWAFVSDFARFKILAEKGGLYFDTDVEVIKPMEDIISRGSFMGCEKTTIAPGLGIGLDIEDEQARNVIDEIVKFYQNIHFLYPDGSMNQKTIVEYTTKVFETFGYTYSIDVQRISGFYIYPGEYFCPMDPETGAITITDNTRSIHHYDASWYGDREKYIVRLSSNLKKIMPKQTAKKMAVVIGTVKYDGLGQTIRRMIKRMDR